MSFTPEIVVIGGGVVGMATAYHLLCAGAPTLLIDQCHEGRATSAGAGILAPEIEYSFEPGADWLDITTVNGKKPLLCWCDRRNIATR